jgi:hypothetical protein
MTAQVGALEISQKQNQRGELPMHGPVDADTAGKMQQPFGHQCCCFVDQYITKNPSAFSGMIVEPRLQNWYTPCPNLSNNPLIALVSINLAKVVYILMINYKFSDSNH